MGQKEYGEYKKWRWSVNTMQISEQLTRKCGPFDFNRAAERFGSSWEMYGPKKTPHFISKNQLLPFPNLAHLLKAQDQGAVFCSATANNFISYHLNTDFEILEI